MTPGLLPGRLSSAARAPQVPASLPRNASAERRREAEARPSISRKQACEPAPKGQGDRSVTGQGARVLRQVSLRRAGALAAVLNDVIPRRIAPAGGTPAPSCICDFAGCSLGSSPSPSVCGEDGALRQSAPLADSYHPLPLYLGSHKMNRGRLHLAFF